jgi:hypothetical protein
MVVVLLPVGYLALRWWLRYSALRGLQAVPVVVESFQPIAGEEVPAETREILADRTAPLVSLGFELLGYLRVSGLIPDVVEIRAVFRHTTDPAFAVVSFGLIGHELGVGVNFYTRFEDGTWLDTCNGRAHQRQINLSQARYQEGLVATFAELWTIHAQAAAKVESPARGVADVGQVADHLGFIDAETARQLVALGEAAPTAVPTQFRRTLAHARRRAGEYGVGIARVTQSPTATMEFAMPRIPLAEQERDGWCCSSLPPRSPRRCCSFPDTHGWRS